MQMRGKRISPAKKRLHLWVAASVAASLSGCGGGDGDTTSSGTPPSTTSPPVATVAPLSCDDGLKTSFKPDGNTQVLFVKSFKKGDPLSLAATPPANAPKATADMCLVKLRVGPGNPGPAGAPSTTAGIGYEVWLPNVATWSGRIRAEAPGAFMGNGDITSSTGIGMLSLAQFGADNNTVTVVTDGGHTDGLFGMFLTLPDGTPNTFGWNEISSRAVHEMSVKVKALATAFYAKAPSKSYIYGCSSGGRAVYQSAQTYPSDYDGIVADAVSLDQTQYFPALMHAQMVMQRDLADQGLPLLTKAKTDAVSAAAVQACDSSVNGSHDGYLTNYDQCKYDPTKDASVLCTSDGGTNTTASCVTKAEAQAINKIWYGPTADGTVPDPAQDNGTNIVRSSNQLWWGHKRGTGLDFVAGTVANAPNIGILAVGTDQIAWNFQDLSYTRPDYINASGTGQNRWMGLSYSQYAQSFYLGKVLNDKVFANIDSNNPDLTKFNGSGAKMLSFVGISDPFVSLEAMLNYYARSAGIAGGNAKAQDFHRLFLIPGRGHCGGTGTVNASSNITPQISADQMYAKLVDWVENKKAPDTIPLTSPDATRSRPICMYPKRVKYVSGDVNSAASYTCQ